MIKGTICSKCGRHKDRCVCEKKHFSAVYKGFAAPYYYIGGARRGVLNLKNSGCRFLAEPMARRIAEAVDYHMPDLAADVVCCVPMTPYRQRKRGYNQSRLLAEKVALELSLPYEDLLVKKRRTKPQHRSSARERKVNLYGAFALKRGANVTDRTVLIIDDVKTTGSTLNECASILRAYGAKAVYAAAFTVTDSKSEPKTLDKTPDNE